MPHPSALPKQFVENIHNIYGDKGHLWLEQLPELLNEIAHSHSLTLGKHFDDLAFNYVTPVKLASGNSAVIKLAPANEGLANECLTLNYFNGHGAIKLLDHDMTKGWIV